MQLRKANCDLQPVIFSGTLRSVLDVFSEHEDKDIYEVLRRVYLLPDPSTVTPEEAAENKFSNLDTEITEQVSFLT
jgi:ABC-type multidrug transport system fused ATPase/permease subunit